MKVYRIETEGKWGPYCGPVELIEWTDRDHVSPKHPSPEADGIGRLAFPEVCGFESLSQLKEWFNETERSNLYKLDFRVSVYEVESSSVRRGLRQVVFHPKSAHLIERILV